MKCLLPADRRRALATLAMACVGVATGGVVHHRRPASRVGIVAFNLNSPVPAALSALGVGLVRGSCDWAALEPAPDAFDWSCSDNVIVGAAAQRLRSYMTVRCTPGWANANAGCGTLPRDMAVWYAFVQRFVARYAAYNTVLGIWNEPNLELIDDPSGAGYALLFANASLARNTVDPEFVLAAPEVSHHALASGYYARAVDAIQSAGAFNPIDVVSVHWYHDGPPLTDYLDAVHAVADRHQVWLSEVGYSTPDADAQAAFYGSVLDAFAGTQRPWWTHVIFYRLWDGRDCCTEAIVTSDYARKPAFDAIREWLETAPDEPDDGNPYELKKSKTAK